MCKLCQCKPNKVSILNIKEKRWIYKPELVTISQRTHTDALHLYISK